MPMFLEGLNLTALIASIVSGVAVLALIVLVFVLLSHSKRKKIPKELQETYERYYTQLTTDCKQSVDRLKSLGRYSPDYQQKYLAKQSQYDKILNERGKDVKDSIDARNELLVSKDKRTLKRNLPDYQKGVEDFKAAVSKFSLELSSLLQDENDTFSGQVAVQEKNRKVREFYENNKEALAPLSDSFKVIFNEAERDFKKFNSLANQGKFKEAQASLTDINQALTLLIQIQDKLPLLAVSLYNVLPQKTDALLTKNEERLQEGFVIGYRNVPEKVKNIRIEIESLCSRLQQLDVEGIDERIQAISKQINDREACFENEEKAKQEFISGQDILSSSSYQLEKRFSRCRNRLPEYQKTYRIDQKYITDREGLKSVIENINLLKTRLDSYTGTGRKESYIVIVRVRNERRSGREKAEKTMDNYDTYLKSIRQTTQSDFTSIRETYYNLKKGERTLRERNVTSCTEVYNPRFAKLEKTAKDRTDLFAILPIDLNTITEKNEKYQTESSALLKEVEEKYRQRQLAEAAIVKGNYYRQEFTDANPGLDRAVTSFKEGDFERSFTEATHVVERRKTDSQNPVSAR